VLENGSAVFFGISKREFLSIGFFPLVRERVKMSHIWWCDWRKIKRIVSDLERNLAPKPGRGSRPASLLPYRQKQPVFSPKPGIDDRALSP
jgi:hypothetical protein